MEFYLFVLLVISGVSISKKCAKDQSFSCPDSATCCPLSMGEGFGCCPFTAATCCPDKIHCCPHGLSCDIKAGRCIGKSYDLLLTQLSTSHIVNKNEEKNENKNVKKLQHGESWPVKNMTRRVMTKTCPDKEFTCNDDETCCPLDGEWGCCPLGPDAVCCDDHEHCCPVGTVCDVDQGTCNKKPKANLP